MTPTPRLVPDRPSGFDGFSAANVVRMLDEWAADQREREGWNDGDKSTYTFRAGLLQAAANRLRDAAAPPAEASGEVRVSIAPNALGDAIEALMRSAMADGAAGRGMWSKATLTARDNLAQLAAAPAAPAEGVDLEQFREAVELLKLVSLGGKRDCERHGTHPHDFDRSLEKAERLLTLIDTAPRVTGGREDDLFTHAPAKAREDGIAELIAAARDVERRAGPDREPRLRAALATFAEGACHD